MSPIVVEFEGFQLSPHNFVIKELAFYDADFRYHGHWSFLPPFSWEQLPDKKRKTFSWLTRNFHNLRWDSGELPYSVLHVILSSLFASYKIIFTKGLEKTKFLENISGKKFLNLNDFNCPKIHFLKYTEVKCPNHKPHFKHCALVKASSYAMYINKRSTLQNVICAQDVNY